MKTSWLATIVTLFTVLTAWPEAYALNHDRPHNLRRVYVDCEVSLSLSKSGRDISFAAMDKNLSQLEILLAQYSSAGTYFAALEEGKPNLPSLILEQAGSIRATLKIMGFSGEASVRSQEEFRELWYHIYKPYAESQVAMGNGLDPESKEGEDFVHERYVESVLWLFESGWLRYDGSGPRVQEVREVLSHAGFTGVHPALVNERRTELLRTLTNTRPRTRF